MTDREKAKLLMAKVESAFERNDLAKIDQMLKDADFSSLSVREGVCLIRSSSRARMQLVFWVSALRRLSVRLKKVASQRHDALLVGLLDFIPARCAVVDVQLRTWRCPLEKGKCMWQHRQTNECCHLEQDLTADQYCSITKADPASEEDILLFKEQLRSALQL